ncbi:2,5-dichloro-2,5-cyclohexadiene-1,4-diol dehydrogenase [hydrothermal vent metagenome]|uniref:2,5-dichloro-2,5-cyclohexadiene-1,4-diol dehydrogenase n=1 Tax=hydrothermal vent metagenome TaxID=652676 RepID=A0A3B0SR52_9ZZZZ
MGERLAGKKAVITGGASGLGVAIARMFVEQGAQVALTDINLAGAQKIADELNASRQGCASAHAHDVADEEQWIDALAKANTEMNGINILVNNAGIGTMGSIEQESYANWKKVMAVDADSVFLGCKYAMQYMKQNQPGSIINMSSIAGLYAAASMPAYNAAKAAVWLLSKSVALHCATSGYQIRSNSIHPVFIRTPILDGITDALGVKTTEERDKVLTRGIPMRRIGEPEDVAYAAVYLASDESKFITGIELKIDGGMSAQ